jgi:transcriptional regulator with XRE-family HTH domain
MPTTIVVNCCRQRSKRPLTPTAASATSEGVSDWQERLAEAIEARGISGGELARRAGFSAQYINSMRSKDRGARLTLDTARRLAHALGVSVEWLTAGTGPRERLSDVYPVYVDGAPPPESAPLTDRYPTRAEAIALLSTTVEPEVITALRAVVPDDPDTDPGRAWWIEQAKGLVRDLRRIKADPELSGSGEEPVEPRPTRTKTGFHKKVR